MTGVSIFLLFPGFPAALGLSVVVARIIRRNDLEREICGKTFPFFIGLLPFILLSIRYENFQPRYLIPVMPLVFLFASAGIRFLTKQRHLSMLLFVPVAVASVSLWETSSHRRVGSILNAMHEMSNGLNQTVCIWNVFPADSDYYSSEDSIQWPFQPYIGSMETVTAELYLESDVIVSYDLPPPGYEAIRTWGETTAKIEVVRGSDSPEWAILWYTLSKPWVWRSWAIACLSVPVP